jgi:hypothetical protein
MVQYLTSLKNILFKYRLKKKFHRPFLIGGIIIASLLILSLLIPPLFNAYDALSNPVASGKIKVNWYKDLNAVHLHYAKRSGIRPFKSSGHFNSKIDEMLEAKRLVKIKSNRYYSVKYLTHSHPYLTPKASNFLDVLGKRYQKKLDENGMGKYLFQISSLLRTNESQKSLSKSNVNASSNTSHLYGLTFDIAYRSVVKKPLPWMKVEVADAKAIKLLSETIGELRREGRCVVVTERIEKCFHITVIR